MKQKQKVFESLYFEQAEANATLRQTQSATSIRKNVEKVLRDYLAYLTIFKDNPEYKTLYGDIQQIIKKKGGGEITGYRYTTSIDFEPQGIWVFIF